MRAVPSATGGAAARVPRSVPSLVAAAVLTALAIAAAVLAARELVQPYPGEQVILEIPTVPLAVFAAGSMLVRHQLVRLFLVAGALGAMAAAGFYAAPVSIGFIYDSSYKVAAALGWMTFVFTIAGFVVAWRESGFGPQRTLVAAVGGGGAGVIVAGFIFWIVLVVTLIIHPLTF